MAKYLSHEPSVKENLVDASYRLERAQAFSTRTTSRELSFDAMLESVREYPDVLDVVGGTKEFDRIVKPGRMLWQDFQKLRNKNPFLRFSIVPYADDAQETLAYACEVMERFPKCTVDGTDMGRQHALFSRAWLSEARRKFPHLTVRYRKEGERTSGLRCEIIDLYPKTRKGMEAAHMGILFAYEQHGTWEFSRSSYWPQHIASGSWALPPVTLDLEAFTKCLLIKTTGEADQFPPPGFHPSIDGEWHPLRLRMGATNHGEYLSFGLPFEDEHKQYAQPVIVKATA